MAKKKLSTEEIKKAVAERQAEVGCKLSSDDAPLEISSKKISRLPQL